jgi:hypothetical protein
MLFLSFLKMVPLAESSFFFITIFDGFLKVLRLLFLKAALLKKLWLRGEGIRAHHLHFVREAH